MKKSQLVLQRARLGDDGEWHHDAKMFLKTNKNGDDYLSGWITINGEKVPVNASLKENGKTGERFFSLSSPIMKDGEKHWVDVGTGNAFTNYSDKTLSDAAKSKTTLDPIFHDTVLFNFRPHPNVPAVNKPTVTALRITPWVAEDKHIHREVLGFKEDVVKRPEYKPTDDTAAPTAKDEDAQKQKQRVSAPSMRTA